MEHRHGQAAGSLPAMRGTIMDAAACAFAEAFSDSERDAVYRAIFERRDIRAFTPRLRGKPNSCADFAHAA